MKKSQTIEARPRKPGRGRPVADTALEFRQKILDSAELCFAFSNFDSVSLKQIAAPVGVTPAMIHYYFGSKQDLLIAVLDQALEPMAVIIGKLSQRQDADIEELVNQLFSFMQLHPNLPLLLFRQVVLPGGPVQDHFLKKLAPRLGGALPELIRNGQNSGRFADALNPAIAALMILSLCMFPMVSKRVAQPALGISYDLAGIDELQKHIIRFIHGGLQSP
jgi:AcrR family transcriptional regulator